MWYGAAEQAVSSIANFVLVLWLANTLAPNQFGEFGVAWSIVYLIESLCWSYLGEGVPPVAMRLPRGRWKSLRTGLVALSLMMCGGIAFLAIAGAAADILLSGGVAELVLATGVACIGLRAQQTLRRVCYLDENRRLSLASTLVATCVLFGSYAAVVSVGGEGSVAALLCWGGSMLAGSLVLLHIRRDFSAFSPVFLGWLSRRLGRAGAWLAPSAIIYWITNYSILPLSAALAGLELSGAFRLIQALFAPLQQGTAVLISVASPRVAREVVRKSRSAGREILLRLTGGLAALSMTYAAAMLIAGPVLLPMLFPAQADLISLLLLALFAATAVAEATRSGISVVLVSVGLPSGILLSRVVGLVCFGGALVLALASPSLATPIALLSAALGGLLAAIYFSWRRLFRGEQS